MKDQHINRRDFLNIVGITAATTTAALYGCAPKDPKGAEKRAEIRRSPQTEGAQKT